MIKLDKNWLTYLVIQNILIGLLLMLVNILFIVFKLNVDCTLIFVLGTLSGLFLLISGVCLATCLVIKEEEEC